MMSRYNPARGVAIPLNPDRPVSWPGGAFIPAGPLYYVGDLRSVDVRSRSNPILRDSEGREVRHPAGASARLMVGFNVQGTTRWTLDDLIPIVEEVRNRQTRTPDATFLLTRGLYRYTAGPREGQVERGEPGAQVIIIDVDGLTHKQFEDEMVELAEIIAARFDQEKVYVEMLRAGQPHETVAVVPP